MTWPRLDSRIGVGGLQDRLLLMASPLPEHAVEAKPDEERNQCEDDDYGQLQILFDTCGQHSARRINIPTLLNA